MRAALIFSYEWTQTIGLLGILKRAKKAPVLFRGAGEAVVLMLIFLAIRPAFGY